MSGKFRPSTRLKIIRRDLGTCQWCGAVVYDDLDMPKPRPIAICSIQHRVPRGMGGTKLAIVSSAANGILMCGDGTRGCHGYVEQHREEATAAGFLISQHVRDVERAILETPVVDHHGLRWKLTISGDRNRVR